MPSPPPTGTPAPASPDLRTGPNTFARRLFSGLPDRYDRLAEVLSMGQNGRWRRAMVDAIVTGTGPNASGTDAVTNASTNGTNASTNGTNASTNGTGTILDVATGTAGVALALAARKPRWRVVGIDLTHPMVTRGRDNVVAARCDDRISLTVGRAEQLPFPDASFDALTFTYLLRYVDDPAATVAELARVVRPGGTVANLEFLAPPSRFWRAWWWGFTRLILPVAGALTGGREWFEVGRFLGPNISRHYRRYPLGWTVGAWHDAGLEDVHVRIMSLGGGLVMWGRKAGG